MDDVIFEEFKGTGNMELRLVRRLAEKRVYPAIDVLASSTRREDLLFDEEELRQIWLLRRMAAMVEEGGGDAAERVIERVSKSESNAEFLAGLKTEVIWTPLRRARIKRGARRGAVHEGRVVPRSQGSRRPSPPRRAPPHHYEPPRL